MHKRKESDSFSFTGDQIPSKPSFNDRKQLMANYQYRIDAIQRSTTKNQTINPKVLDLDRVIEQNAKRKQQIQQQLKLSKQDLVEPKHLKELIEKNVMHIEAKQFSHLKSQKNNTMQKQIRPLSTTKKSYQPSKIQLNHLQLALIEKQLTFPQYPSISKQKQLQLKSKLETLSKVHQHSDIIYLLIVSSYHLDLFYDVLNRVRELIVFKRFNPRGLWIAAEAAYNLEIYDECNKLAELSMSHIKDNAKILPRLVYLKAKSNLQLHNHLEAMVSYNQLITLQPKVPEYYLERSLLFERSNYNEYARKDFQKYKQLKANWKNDLCQRVLGTKSKDHKQYYESLMRSLEEY